MFGMRFDAPKPTTERIRLIQHVRTVMVDIAHSEIGRDMTGLEYFREP